MTRRLAGLVVLSALACPVAAGGCTGPACSDDPRTLGNERVCWAAVPDPDLSHYVVEARSTGPDHETNRVTVQAPATCLTIAGTPLVRPNDPVEIRVSACDTGGLCGAWSNVVTVQPWACLRQVNCRWVQTTRGPRWTCDGVETPCYPGAPRRAPWLPFYPAE